MRHHLPCVTTGNQLSRPSCTVRFGSKQGPTEFAIILLLFRVYACLSWFLGVLSCGDLDTIDFLTGSHFPMTRTAVCSMIFRLVRGTWRADRVSCSRKMNGDRPLLPAETLKCAFFVSVSIFWWSALNALFLFIVIYRVLSLRKFFDAVLFRFYSWRLHLFYANSRHVISSVTDQQSRSDCEKFFPVVSNAKHLRSCVFLGVNICPIRLNRELLSPASLCKCCAKFLSSDIN